jgi:hypothetical protein
MTWAESLPEFVPGCEVIVGITVTVSSLVVPPAVTVATEVLGDGVNVDDSSVEDAGGRCVVDGDVVGVTVTVFCTVVVSPLVVEVAGVSALLAPLVPAGSLFSRI